MKKIIIYNFFKKRKTINNGKKDFYIQSLLSISRREQQPDNLK